MRRLRKKDRTLSLRDVRAHPLFQVPQDTPCDDPFALPIEARPEFRRGELACAFCSLPGFDDFAKLAWHVQHDCLESPVNRTKFKVGHRLNRKEKQNMKVSERAAQMPSDNAPLLHGSDVPKGKMSIKIKILGIRIPPKDFNAFFIADISEFAGKEAWAINRTNATHLSNLLGDDTDKWVNKAVTLWRVSVNNPKTNKPTWSLSAAEPE
jgi:hypothetical protein